MLKVATVDEMRTALGILAGVAWVVLLAARLAAETSPRELYRALNALRVEPHQVYYVKDLDIRRDAVRLTLVQGKLAFLVRYDGRLTGAVFTGRGHALALPRDPIEKAQLARFLGTPLLDHGFSRAYFRFTDDTGEELLRQLREAGTPPADEPGFAEEWNGVVGNLNPWHSLRILTDWLAAEPRPYFYAGLLSDTLGPFDVLADDRRPEQVLMGQQRWVAGERFYDVWTSFRRTDRPQALTATFVPVAYAIETSILADRTLEGTATMTLKALAGGERMVSLELSRYLTVRSAEDAEGHSLVFFQNDAVDRHEITQRGNDVLLVVLPSAAHAGEEFRLRITYQGSVISDAGNGVYFVGDRGSWYPHIGGGGNSVPFELTFRWPRRLTLVATGEKLEEHEEGEQRIGRWRSEVPIPVTGFNLGEYAVEKVDAGGLKIELYANRQLEEAMAQRFRGAVILSPVPRLPTPELRSGTSAAAVVVPDVPPSPAASLRQLGLEIARAARFYEGWNGPFPYQRLAVSQIPGTFGQGWPGLLYLSTLSFLPPYAQQRAGLSTRVQEQVTDLLPYHEVAHQWWGNLVGWANYRDLWIHEGLANYMALLYADSKKPPDHALAAWLIRYRNELAAKEAGHDESVEQAGPLVLGYRLRCSKAPNVFEPIIYGKGTWVFHMLRLMLRDPKAKNPDERFVHLLRLLLERHRYHSLTTEELQRAVESVMTPTMALEGDHSMDWFFDQWVRSTGIPRFSVRYTVQAQANSFLVRGTLKQRGVPDNFLAVVPLYAARPGGKPARLGNVVVSGAETPFQFVSRTRPRHLLIDPQLTLLCLTE